MEERTRASSEAVSVGLVGYTSTGAAQLYAANAEETGPLTLCYVDSAFKAGSVEVRMPDGEVLKVRYSDRHSQSGTFIGRKFVPSKSPGTASLIGDQGTRMTCDFVVNGHAIDRYETIA